MKVAISSASFSGLLAAGNLTQLEWLEGCASRLGADGVVFARAHFPRTDADYLAQVKKVAVDLGLVPLAVDDPELFTASGAAGEPAAVDIALAVGAPFVMTTLPPPGEVPPAAFAAAVNAAKAVVRAAKARNITLLVGIAPGTLARNVAELRHFGKDVDSAWLRYALPAGIDRGAFNARDRALVVTVDDPDAAALAELDDSARPWILLHGEADAARIDAIRRAAAKKTLAETSVS